MLAGQNSVQPLAYYAKRMAEFSDDDLTNSDIPVYGKLQTYSNYSTGYLWGAYGYRWRNWFRRDQLEDCISILNNDRITRRVVLTMWEPADLTRVLTKPSCKDVPCNLTVLFLPRPSEDTHRLHVGQQLLSPREQELSPVTGRNGELTHMMSRHANSRDDDMKGCTLLDMTVINRSNDTLWGALGSNYVHFSFLHEYVANACGMGVGHYHQVTNNLHIYTNQSQTLTTDVKWSDKWNPSDLCKDLPHVYTEGYEHYPLFTCPINDADTTKWHRELFNIDCLGLFNDPRLFDYPNVPTSPFFKHVVKPMLESWRQHKLRNYDMAEFEANQILPIDWRTNCLQWLARRAASYARKTTA